MQVHYKEVNQHMIRGKKGIVVAVSMSAMLVLLSACSGGKISTDSHAQSSASTDPSEQQEITLTVFSTLANYAGDQPGWFAKLIKDKFNIKLNIIGGGQQKEARCWPRATWATSLLESRSQMPSKPACCWTGRKRTA